MYLPEHIQLSWEKTVPIKGPNPDPLIFLPLHSKDGMRERKKTYIEPSEKHQFVFKCYHTIHELRHLRCRTDLQEEHFPGVAGTQETGICTCCTTFLSIVPQCLDLIVEGI